MNGNNLLKFRIEPITNFSLIENQKAMKDAITKVKNKLNKEYFLIIGGKERGSGEIEPSVNPSNPSEVIGRVHFANREQANEAIEIAAQAFEKWSRTPPKERANCLKRCAEIMKSRKLELSAWMILECGKNWEEADADVCEAIDFLDYYAYETMNLFEKKLLGHVPGETDHYFYEPRGVAAIISPWNFPLAILTGMSSAALVTGNTAVIKPSGQSSVIAAKLMEIYKEGGIPDGVVNYLPGRGSVIGDLIVTHPKVAVIAFTGSVEVGSRINKLASEVNVGDAYMRPHFVKKVITEMGGKNAIIIDSTADIDEAVKGVVISAFGYQGQKCSACSRVIVFEEVYEKFLNRLINATKSIIIGRPEEPETFLGPLIDKSALENTKKYIDIGKKEARLVLEMEVPKIGTEQCSVPTGYYIGPVIFADVPPESRIAQEEIFAPVLSVIKVKDINEALKVANSTRFALTGGIFSRTPEHIELIKQEFKVGNLYINRKITGAIVGRQPFGGFKLSGIGSKSGGYDYLQQFMVPRTITENTMRHGFAPIE